MSQENTEITQGAPGSQPPTDGSPAPDAGGTEIHTKKALHKGFNGEIETSEDLVKYTQNLESLLMTRPATPQPQSFAPSAPTVSSTAKGESFEELVYSDPLKAKEVLLNEFQQRQDLKDEKKKAEAGFWDSFYQKNADLKDLSHVVQSVFKRDRSDFSNVQRFSSDTLVAEHLAKEARQIIGLVKEKTGVRETQVDSSPAMTFSDSSAPGGTRPAQPQKPISFADQIVRLRNKRK